MRAIITNNSGQKFDAIVINMRKTVVGSHGIPLGHLSDKGKVNAHDSSYRAGFKKNHEKIPYSAAGLKNKTKQNKTNKQTKQTKREAPCQEILWYGGKNKDIRETIPQKINHGTDSALYLPAHTCPASRSW